MKEITFLLTAQPFSRKPFVRHADATVASVMVGAIRHIQEIAYRL